MEDFEPALTLFGESGALQKSIPDSEGIAVSENRLLVFWSQGESLHGAATSFPINGDSKWKKWSSQSLGNVTVEQILTDPRGRVVILYREKHSNPVKFSMSLAVLEGNHFNATTFLECEEAVYSPRGCFDQEGNLEIMWMASELTPNILYIRLDAHYKASAPQRLHEGINPDIASSGNRTFIVSGQLDGTQRVDLRKDGHLIDIQRLGGRARYQPSLKVDEHGIVWLFAVDADQRGMYYRRFLGEEFSFEAQCGGAPGQWWMSMGYSVLSCTQDSQSGFAILRGEYTSEDHRLISQSENYRYCFDYLPVPRYSVRDSRHVLFLDLLEVAEMENLEQVVATARRSEANPLNLTGPPGSLDAAWSGYATVLLEKRKFRCWYTGSSDKFERKWNTCYAESENGIDWIKPELGLVEYEGSKKNNLLFPLEYCTGGALIFRDESDPDPSRRYKLFIDTHHHGGPELNLTYSADGIHWQLPPPTLVGQTSRTQSGASWFQSLGRGPAQHVSGPPNKTSRLSLEALRPGSLGRLPPRRLPQDPEPVPGPRPFPHRVDGLQRKPGSGPPHRLQRRSNPRGTCATLQGRLFVPLPALGRGKLGSRSSIGSQPRRYSLFTHSTKQSLIAVGAQGQLGFRDALHSQFLFCPRRENLALLPRFYRNPDYWKNCYERCGHSLSLTCTGFVGHGILLYSLFID